MNRFSRHTLPAVAFLATAWLACVVPRVVQAQGGALPQPVGYVNDFANVIPSDSRSRLEALSQQLHAATRGDLVVVTLADLGGRPVEEVSLRLGREWKVGGTGQAGDQARNAGVIILLAIAERQCRVEVGQGAEGFVTDATAGALCRAAGERFRTGDYGGGLEGIAYGVADRWAAALGVTLDGSQRPQRRSRQTGGNPPSFALIVLLVLFVLVANGFGGGRRKRGCVGCIPIPIVPGPVIYPGRSHGWGGGGFGGGGFGGGGFGGFGGGGGFSGGGGGSNW
jgi:uncharacterized protein